MTENKPLIIPELVALDADAGPGTVLAGLVHRTLPDATVHVADEELAGVR